MPSPNLPNGFDFSNPDVYAERLPAEELAEHLRLMQTAADFSHSARNEEHHRNGKKCAEQLILGEAMHGESVLGLFDAQEASAIVEVSRSLLALRAHDEKSSSPVEIPYFASL